MGTHTEDTSSVERRSRAVRHWLKSYRRFGSSTTFQAWQYKAVPPLQTDSQSALAVCTRRRPGRLKHIELKMLTMHEWLTTGRLRIRIVSIHHNPDDLMTKAMIREKLIKFGRALNLRGSIFPPTYMSPTTSVVGSSPVCLGVSHRPQRLLLSH